jgi:hypothetical protein
MGWPASRLISALVRTPPLLPGPVLVLVVPVRGLVTVP